MRKLRLGKMRQCNSAGLDPTPLIGISSSLLGFLPETLHHHQAEGLKQFWGPKALNRSCAISIGNNWFAELDWDFVYQRPELCERREKQTLCKWPTRSHSPLHYPSLHCVHNSPYNKLLLFLPRSMSCRIIFYFRTTEPWPPSGREQLEEASHAHRQQVCSSL